MRWAAVYDAIYAWRDYETEIARLLPRLVGKTVLDVACGTGTHAAMLRARGYEVTGVDVDPAMVELCAAKNAGMPLHLGDMATFDLRRKFSTVICMFSSIGYAERLDAAMTNLARHCEPGGAVLVEPWLTPENFDEGPAQLQTGEAVGVKVARMALVRRVDRDETLLRFQYLVGRADSIEHFEEDHRLRLWSDAEYRGAFDRAGLSVDYDAEGPVGRGLYIGRKAQ